MENEDVIREKMEDTRSSLTEKLETLEKQVVSTVQDATSSVTETVEAVKDTVNTVRETVQDTVQSTVDSVKGLFDIPGHVNRHPWAAVGGSVAVGFILGRIFAPPRVEIRRMEEASVRPSTGDLSLSSFASEGAQPAYRSPDYGHPNGKGQNGNGAHNGAHHGGGLVSGLSSMLGMFQPELNRLKGLAIGAVMDAVRQSVMNAAPANLREPLADLVNNVTEKLGGQPTAGAGGAGPGMGGTSYSPGGRQEYQGT